MATITTTSLNPQKFFDLLTGAVGFLQFIDQLRRHFVPFHPYGQAFLTGVDEPPLPPHEDALRTTQQPIPSTPASLKSTGIPRPNRTLADDLANESAAGGGPAPVPTATTTDTKFTGTTAEQPAPKASFLYEHNENGIGLTKDGYKAFDAAYRIYEQELKLYDNAQLTFVAWLPTQMKPNAVDALEASPLFNPFLSSPNIAHFRKLLDSVFNKPSTIRSIADFTALHNNAMHPSDTTTVYTNRLRAKITALRSTYESISHPGYISIDSIHLSCLLAGLRPEYKPLVDQLIIGDTSIHTLTTTYVEERIRAYELDQQSYASATNRNNNNNNNRSRHINITTQPITQALITTTASHWTLSHPHTKPRGTGAGPGDVKRPHCLHCAQNGHVYNNHGFEGAAKGPLCHDLERKRTSSAATPAAAPATPPHHAADQAAVLTAAFTALLAGQQPDHPIDEAALYDLGSSLASASP